MSAMTTRKFRETLWFAKGEKDAQVADEAAQSGDMLAPDAVDLLPIEDRYIDDGSVRTSMTEMYGLHTGKTGYMEKLNDSGTPGGTTLNNNKAIIGDLKLGGRRVAAAIGLALAAIGAAVLGYMA